MKDDKRYVRKKNLQKALLATGLSVLFLFVGISASYTASAVTPDEAVGALAWLLFAAALVTSSFGIVSIILSVLGVLLSVYCWMEVVL